MDLENGSEAIVSLKDGYLVKERVPKRYRVAELDMRIRKERTRAEARLISEARRCGVPTPIIHDVHDQTIEMEYIDGKPVKYIIDNVVCESMGKLVGRLHSGSIIHGDLTTSNMLVRDDRLYLIDFGLAFVDGSVESRGVDIHVLFQTLESTHAGHKELIKAFSRGYREALDMADEVLERVKEIEKRGRYA